MIPGLLELLLDGYAMVVLAAVVVSWLRLSPDNPVVRLTHAATEPLLAPIPKVLPAAGGFDFSPMLLLLGIQLVRRVLFR